MIRFIIAMAFVSLSFSAQAKEFCTMAQIMLKPAKNNICFDRLVSQTKNAEDRKWLLNLKNSWNPSPQLQIHVIAAGAEFYDGDKFIGSFQWLSMNPPILSINGVMKVGENGDEKSIVAIVQKLFNEKTTAQFLYQSLLPDAQAQDNNTEKMQKLTILFSIMQNSDPKTAEELFSKAAGNFALLFMPDMTWWQKYIMNLPLKCTADGVQGVPFQLDQDREISISQKSSNQFIIDGLVPGKKMIAAYKPLPQKVGNPCMVITSKEMDEKFCQPGWEEFFKSYPKARAKYAALTPGPSALLDCVAFQPDYELVEACGAFWFKQAEKYEHYLTATVFPNPEPNMKVYECLDEQCKNASAIKDGELLERALGEKTKKKLEAAHNAEIQILKADYIKFLKAKGIQQADDVCSDNQCVLPKLDNLSIKDQREARALFQKLSQTQAKADATKAAVLNTEVIGYAVTGTKLLGECCKSDACRANAQKHLSIELEKAKNTTK